MFNIDKVLDEDKIIDYDGAFNTQQWLTKKNLPLKDVSVGKINAGDLIEGICKAEKFSQRLILITGEREQTLLSRNKNSVDEKVLIKSMGCGWTDGHTLSGYGSFEKQIKGAIITYKTAFYSAVIGEKIKVDHEKVWLPQKKKHVWIPRNNVLPRNKITYSLYKYTPHIGDKRSPFYNLYNGPYGCYATYLLWNKFFS